MRDCPHGRQIGKCDTCDAQELERENERLQKENADLKFRLQDWHEAAEQAWKNPCADEIHCGCVPLLQKIVNGKEKENKELAGRLDEIVTLSSELLRKTRTMHLDMGGKHRYTLAHDAYRVVEPLRQAVSRELETK